MQLESLTKKQNEAIKKILIKEGFDKHQIGVILNKYTSFNKMEDLRSGKHNQPRYKEVMCKLYDGAQIDELENISEHQDDIEKLKGFLKQNKISMQDALSLYDYSTGSSSILNLKRKMNNLEIYMCELDENLYKNLKKIEKIYAFDCSRENVNRFINFAKNIDYNISIEKCKILMHKYINENNLPKVTHSLFMKYVQDLAEYYSVAPTINSLDESLKNQLPYNIILYRAVSTDFIFCKNGFSNNFKNLVGKKIEDMGYTSTSMLYETSFARYLGYPIVFKILAPKASQGFNITPISDFHYENEVLLNSNDLFIIDCNENFVDEKGYKKILFTALLLSKDRECYRGLSKKARKEKIVDEENS